MATNEAMRMSEFYAVVAGVGAYSSPQFSDIPATILDGRSLYGVLTDPFLCHYAPECAHPLLGDGATLDGFRSELLWLARTARPTSTALLYFSGHGGRVELPLGAASSHESYLCFRETDPDNLPATALSATELSETLRHIHARRLVVILDACFAAGAANLKAAAPADAAWRAGLTSEEIERLGMGAGRVVIASSSASQASLVREEGDASLFTHYLLEALRGAAGVRRDGFIHVLDVYHYVSEAVRQRAPRQTPILKADDLDSNFPIALDRGGASPHPADLQDDLTRFRNRLIADPMDGSVALSKFLASQPGHQTQQVEVDHLRAELLNAQREITETDSAPMRVERSRLIYLLLDLCARIERGEPSSSALAAPSAPPAAATGGMQVTVTGPVTNQTIAQTATIYNNFPSPERKDSNDPSTR